MNPQYTRRFLGSRQTSRELPQRLFGFDTGLPHMSSNNQPGHGSLPVSIVQARQIRPSHKGAYQADRSSCPAPLRERDPALLCDGMGLGPKSSSGKGITWATGRDCGVAQPNMITKAAEQEMRGDMTQLSDLK